MEVIDNTINVAFREVNTGMCFVWGMAYYMKIRTTEYNGYTSEDEYKYVGLNLRTGFTEKIMEEEKVRVIKTKLVID